MEIEIAALCDAATGDPQGKLNILGTFDTIVAREFPVVHPYCAIAFRIRFGLHEQGAMPIRVTFIDEDGHAVVPPLEGDLEVQFPEGCETVVTNHIVNLQGLKLAKPGTYSIDLSIGGRQIKSLYLRVVKAPQAP